MRPTAAGLRILKQLIIAAYTRTGCLDAPDEVGASPIHALTTSRRFSRISPDLAPSPPFPSSSRLHPPSSQVGAFPIHALTVCNSPESIALVLELCRQRPDLMSLTHVRHRAGMPIFLGESTLHIFAVNQREAELVELVQLAMDGLSVSAARALFRSPAEGLFFGSKPMLFFGGTALAYAIAFELADAVRAILATGLCELNEREAACPLSGFFPLHAAVACGSTAMCDLPTISPRSALLGDSPHLNPLGGTWPHLESDDTWQVRPAHGRAPFGAARP